MTKVAPAPPEDGTKPVASPHPLDLEIQQRFLALGQNNMVQAEYVWLGGHFELRCKTKTLDKVPTSVDELPVWNYDGSSTDQAPGVDSEVLLKPRAIYKDPFRAGPSGSSPNILVMCDCHKPDPDKPDGIGDKIDTNTRVDCASVMEKIKDKEPWFGIEQEYTLFEPDGVTPYGWPKGGVPDRPQGPYYCSIGTENAYGRPIVEAHYRACMYAGINISGINGEVMPGQWEYQVGPCTGIESGDQLWMSRYLLIRVCEQFGIRCSFDPKPIPGDWNGAGCHTNGARHQLSLVLTLPLSLSPCPRHVVVLLAAQRSRCEAQGLSFCTTHICCLLCHHRTTPTPTLSLRAAGGVVAVSTKEMREDGGYDLILKAMDRLGADGKQEEHIKAYDISGGEDNKRRLTGAHETVRAVAAAARHLHSAQATCVQKQIRADGTHVGVHVSRRFACS